MTRISPPSLRLTRRALLGALALAPFAGMAAHAADAPLKLSDDDRNDLKRISAYLDSIHTMRARFQQVAAGGGLASGKIFLRRPGMLRVAYETPMPELMEADGLWANHYERDLDLLVHDP